MPEIAEMKNKQPAVHSNYAILALPGLNFFNA